ncbi:MAG: formylglycine-generating enzyme family protein, partial [Gemmatimonadota bacterium]|nr:formylglycine-generating enzyme family protein [Gemmatimonadota bacterium]
YDAVAYCNALSASEGLTPCYSGSGSGTVCDWNANGYRLPTEAEWEYACRAGTETAYYTGVNTNTECADPNLDMAGWYCGNASNTTHPTEEKVANASGLYDMHGNVWEWCWDWYGSYSGQETDPAGPGSGSDRVIRGGSWYDFALGCRSANRGNYGPGYANAVIGFRPVRLAF